MSDLFDLTQETAVVLGGTGALGGAMASALADAGARRAGRLQAGAGLLPLVH